MKLEFNFDNYKQAIYALDQVADMCKKGLPVNIGL